MEQIFIHQSMVDSVLFELYAADKTITPSGSLRDQLLQIFYEIGHTYGQDVTMELDLSFTQTQGELV